MAQGYTTAIATILKNVHRLFSVIVKLLNYFLVILEVLTILSAISWKPGMSKVQQSKNFIY